MKTILQCIGKKYATMLYPWYNRLPSAILSAVKFSVPVLRLAKTGLVIELHAIWGYI